MKIFFLAVFITIFSKNCLSWSGYDYENNATIEIGSGNLVRAGNMITIYDWSKDEYHDVEVQLIEDDSNGTILQIYDLEEKRKRIFMMED